jgi:glyoxylase-like metal-dependent hydrolase (beta-lactamase superfamily II)
MEGQLRELGNGLYTCSRPLTGYGGYVSASLLLLPGQALVVDTLCKPEDMEGFVRLIGDRAVTVVYTHADWDHCQGCGALNPVKVIAHELTLKRLSEEGEDTLSALRRDNPELVAGASIVLPDTTFGDRLSLEFPAGPGSENVIRVELLHLPGHTDDSSVCFVPEMGVLFAGDAVEDPFPSVAEPLSTGSWSDALDELAKKVSLVIPGHGPVSGPELPYGNARYLRGLMGAARRNTPYPWLTPDVSLEVLDPASAKALLKLGSDEQVFYRDIHKENVRRVLSVL